MTSGIFGQNLYLPKFAQTQSGANHSGVVISGEDAKIKKKIAALSASILASSAPLPNSSVIRSFVHSSIFEPSLWGSIAKFNAKGTITLLHTSPELVFEPYKSQAQPEPELQSIPNLQKILSRLSSDALVVWLRQSVGPKNDSSMAQIASNRRMFDVLISSSRFNEIPANDLGGAFKDAAENGHAAIVTALINSLRFNEIPANDLGSAIKAAAMNGHVAIVNALINSRRFDHIPTDDLGKAFVRPAETGNAAIDTTRINSPPFKKREPLSDSFHKEQLFDFFGHLSYY